MKFDEKRWQAESDANTLADYQAIISDKKRLSAAMKIAKSKADELNKRASAMGKVYSMGGKMSTRKKK